MSRPGMKLVNRKIGEGIFGGFYRAGEARLDVRSEDIIGDVVIAFNAMSKTIVDRFNQDRFIHDLTSKLASSVDRGDSSRTIFQGFIETIGAYGCVLYAGGDQVLELQAVEGIDFPGQLPEKVEEAHGAVNKAISTGRIIDIRSDRERLEWFGISTPLGSLKSEIVKIIPLQVEKKTIGFVVPVPDGKMDKEAVRKVEDLRMSLTPQLENVLFYQRIKEMAVVDKLTSCYNRRFGEQMLEEVFSSYLRKNLPLNLLMLELIVSSKSMTATVMPSVMWF